MSPTAVRSAVINARVEGRHAEQLREIADHNASTVSRIVGRIIAQHLDNQRPLSSSLRLPK